MIVYVDVLIVLNFIVNYLLLLLSARLCGRGVKLSRLRITLAALIGAAGSLIIFLPQMGAAANILFKLAFSSLLAAVSGGYKDGRGYIKRLFMLIATSFVFAGFMLFITLLSGGRSGFYYNGVCYFNVSGVGLLICCALVYGIVTAYQRLISRGALAVKELPVTIVNDGKELCCTGVVDSQNNLCDAFSGTPVVIGSYRLLSPILPDGFWQAAQTGQGCAGLRLIPCATVAGQDLLPAFRPEHMLLDLGEGPLMVQDVYIAVSKELDGVPGQQLLLNRALTGKRVQTKMREKAVHKC